MSIYGEKLSSEVLAERNAFDRQVVSEITRLGVSDDQIAHICYLLALELTDRESMLKLTAFVKENWEHIFLAPKEGEE